MVLLVWIMGLSIDGTSAGKLVDDLEKTHVEALKKFAHSVAEDLDGVRLPSFKGKGYSAKQFQGIVNGVRRKFWDLLAIVRVSQFIIYSTLQSRPAEETARLVKQILTDLDKKEDYEKVFLPLCEKKLRAVEWVYALQLLFDPIQTVVEFLKKLPTVAPSTVNLEEVKATLSDITKFLNVLAEYGDSIAIEDPLLSKIRYWNDLLAFPETQGSAQRLSSKTTRFNEA